MSFLFSEAAFVWGVSNEGLEYQFASLSIQFGWLDCSERKQTGINSIGLGGIQVSEGD